MSATIGVMTAPASPHGDDTLGEGPVVARRAASGERLELLRRLWGYGVSGVLILAIVPYPLMAVFGGDHQMHRVHDTVGAVHYLLWWGAPVLWWSHRRRDPDLWIVAFVCAGAIAGSAIASGDLVGSGSWAPLLTVLPLLPGREQWRGWRIDVGLLAVAAVLVAMAARLAPDLVHVQDVAASDPHGARYHYGGMAAAYLSAGLVAIVAVVRPGRAVRWLLGVGCLAIGGFCLLWPAGDSSLPAAEAWVYLSCGAVVLVSAAYDASRARSASRLLAAS